MSIKSAIKKSIRVVAHLPGMSQIVFHPAVRRIVEKLPGGNGLYASGWELRHPFDCAHGTDTSGFVPSEDLLTGEAADAFAIPYAGSQPGVQRAALAAIPHLERCTFVDLGCGKGRPLFVATEFPFRDIVGVELAPRLAKIAQKNADIMAKRYPERTRVRIETGDASNWLLPSGDVVLMFYNPFEKELVEKVVRNVETALATDSQRSIYVLYYNPVCGNCFDDSSMLVRRFARTLPYAPEEIGYGPGKDDAVVIWQGGTAPPPETRADARIVVTLARFHCVLEEEPPVAAALR